MPLLMFKLFGGKLLNGLAKLSIWQILCIILGLSCLMQTVRLHSEQRHANKLEAQIVKIAADAKAQKAKLDAANRQIADEIRKRTDEENRRIAADANGLRLSGPGRARACAPAAPGGHQPTSGKPDAAGPEMPSDDSAAVPWNWLVQRAETNDLNRAEVLAWRDWYDRLLKQWPKSN